MNLFRFFIILVFLIYITGCGRFTEFLDDVAPDTKKDYLKARTLPDLSIPPELSSGTIKDKMFIPDSSEKLSFENFNERKMRSEQPKKAFEPEQELFELGMIEERPVLLARIDRELLWSRLRRFWENEEKQLILDDVQLGIMETSWIESTDKLTRQRFKIYTELGKEEGLNIVFAVCERQVLESEDTAYGVDDIWSETTRILQEELNIMNRLRDKLSIDGNLIALNQNTDSQTYESTPPLEKEQKYTSGGSKYFKNKPYQVADVPQKNEGLDNASIIEPQNQLQTVEKKPDVSLSAFRNQPITSQKNNDTMTNSSFDQTTANRVIPDSNIDSLNPQVVAVGRGNFYLTVENSYSLSWKLIERAIRRSGMGIRQADKARGVFVVNMSENALEKESFFGKVKFWGAPKSSQFQVSLTGIGDKTEIVILDREGKWLTNQRSERLLDRLYNTLNNQ